MAKEIRIVGNHYKWYKLNIKKYAKFKNFENIIWSMIHFYIDATSGFYDFFSNIFDFVSMDDSHLYFM